jgi:hypothetical protein
MICRIIIANKLKHNLDEIRSEYIKPKDRDFLLGLKAQGQLAWPGSWPCREK